MKEVDAYIAKQPARVAALLRVLRHEIHRAAPECEEVISYGMPAFKLTKALVYFAACKDHIGFYPTPSPIKKFAKELEKFRTSKGAIQLPLDEALPLALIRKIVKFRVSEVSGQKSPQNRKNHV